MPQSVTNILSQPIPTVKYVIPGLIPENGHIIISGRGKIGKSYLALEMTSCLVRKAPFLSIFPALNPVKVLLVQAEMPANVFIVQRLFPMAKVCQCSDTDRFFLEQSTSFRLSNIDDVARLKASIDSCSPDLLIVDPLYSIHVGSFNEAGAVNETLQTLNFLSNQCHCAVCLVAHFRKESTTNSGKRIEQDWVDIMGSALFSAWADTIISVVPDENNDNRRKLSFVTRWLPNIGEMIVDFNAVPPFYSACSISPKMRIMSELVSGKATSASAIAKRLGVNYAQTLQFLKNMADTNILFVVNGEYKYSPA